MVQYQEVAEEPSCVLEALQKDSYEEEEEEEKEEEEEEEEEEGKNECLLAGRQQYT